MYHKIRFNHGASVWEEALPLGNGKFGAMVWGGPDIYRYSLNLDTFWTNSVRDDSVPNRADEIKKQRDLIENRKFVEAEQHAKEYLKCPNESASYLPVGDILIEKTDGTAFKGCNRELDLETATIHETYIHCYPKTHTCRTYIARNEDVMISEFQFESNSNYAISFSNHLPKTITTFKDGLGIFCTAQSSKKNIPLFDQSENNVSFGLCIKVLTDGVLTVYNNEIFVQDAKSITLLAAGETNFVAWNKLPDKTKDIVSIANQKIENALKIGLEQVYKNHINAHQELYNRVSLTLPYTKEDTFCAETERMTASNEAIELMFNFGRYLLITSSAKGSLPANLQGIWNNKFIPPWCSGYTANINVEMNYWLAEPANLSECHEPLLTFIENLKDAGKQVAKDYYNCEGWVSHHNNDMWCKAAPAQGFPQHAIWPMGSGWLCEHLWTHYIYTLDKDFLKNKAYPITKEAIRFYLDFLYEDKDGHLVTCPSVSPENSYNIDGERVAVTKMSAMDNCILRELFENFLKMADILNIDDAFVQSAKETLSKLAPFKIDSQGRLMEWNEEFIEREPGHRHLSHLYGLYPGDVLLRDEKLKTAAEKALWHRLNNGGGHTGWSCGWIILLLASLKDAENAKKYVDKLLLNSSFPNLFDAHPPFQIDGNFAFTAGVIHMLMQSRAKEDFVEIELLPACPDVWNEGALKGVCAAYGITLDFEWNEENVKITATAKAPVTVHFICRGKETTLLVDGTSEIIL